MITRDKLNQMIAEARKDVTAKRELLEAVRKDESIGSPERWSACVDYSNAVTKYTTLVDILTYKDNDDT